MVLKIYQNANSPQGCVLYFAKYRPQPASNIPHGEFLSTVNLNFVPQRNNSTANIRIQHMYVRSGLSNTLQLSRSLYYKCGRYVCSQTWAIRLINFRVFVPHPMWYICIFWMRCVGLAPLRTRRPEPACGPARSKRKHEKAAGHGADGQTRQGRHRRYGKVQQPEADQVASPPCAPGPFLDRQSDRRVHRRKGGGSTGPGHVERHSAVLGCGWETRQRGFVP